MSCNNSVDAGKQQGKCTVLKRTRSLFAHILGIIIIIIIIIIIVDFAQVPQYVTCHNTVRIAFVKISCLAGYVRPATLDAVSLYADQSSYTVMPSQFFNVLFRTSAPRLPCIVYNTCSVRGSYSIQTQTVRPLRWVDVSSMCSILACVSWM